MLGFRDNYKMTKFGGRILYACKTTHSTIIKEALCRKMLQTSTASIRTECPDQWLHTIRISMNSSSRRRRPKWQLTYVLFIFSFLLFWFFVEVVFFVFFSPNPDPQETPTVYSSWEKLHKMALTTGKDHMSFVLGDVKRVLPVCEVKPGVRVALFNPLGGM